MGEMNKERNNLQEGGRGQERSLKSLNTIHNAVGSGGGTK